MTTPKQAVILKVALFLFLFNATSALSAIVYVLAWEVIAIVWIVAFMAVLTLLLITILVGLKAKYKEDGANNKNYTLNHIHFKQILCNIWLRVHSGSLKFLNVEKGAVKSKGIRDTNNGADNHAFHK
jgi:hypothetical protein